MEAAAKQVSDTWHFSAGSPGGARATNQPGTQWGRQSTHHQIYVHNVSQHLPCPADPLPRLQGSWAQSCVQGKIELPSHRKQPAGLTHGRSSCCLQTPPPPPQQLAQLHKLLLLNVGPHPRPTCSASTILATLRFGPPSRESEVHCVRHAAGGTGVHGLLGHVTFQPSTRDAAAGRLAMLQRSVPMLHGLYRVPSARSCCTHQRAPGEAQLGQAQLLIRKVHRQVGQMREGGVDAEGAAGGQEVLLRVCVGGGEGKGVCA